MTGKNIFHFSQRVGRGQEGRERILESGSSMSGKKKRRFRLITGALNKKQEDLLHGESLQQAINIWSSSPGSRHKEKFRHVWKKIRASIFKTIKIRNTMQCAHGLLLQSYLLSLYLQSVRLTTVESSRFPEEVCILPFPPRQNIFYQCSLQRGFRSSLSCFTHL